MHTFQLLDTTLSLFSTAMGPGSNRRRPRLSREEFTPWAVKWLALLQDMGFFVEIPPDLPESLHADAATVHIAPTIPTVPTVRQGTFYANQYEPLPDADAGGEYITDTPGMDAGMTSDGQASWLRLRGCDYALPYTECGFFDRLMPLRDVLEFCPGDQAGCATALAVLWLLRGGRRVAGSIGGAALHGASSGPALEEVALCLENHEAPTGLRNLHRLPEAAALLHKVGFTVSPHKPVLGSQIFAVESGIHVDGIAKNPALYEAYAPESVGLERSIVVGKHSGRAALRLKAAQLGIDLPEAREGRLLAVVQKMAVRQQHSLNDRQFATLCESIALPLGRKQRAVTAGAPTATAATAAKGAKGATAQPEKRHG
ncbi:MAG: hypothetical protein BCS36_00085 [Desulfovibrio sp. MES5]|uniref:homocitrate synthase/isopropylmalate synthase family protein n=1 Tax=Desulfovibrio sp. MES5 TaxID=1899016 RepID=UPI000B9D0D46|nr:hypothetical protein [Desulfovibrio sp. MES5]OXS29318.1 MAG: hypothetical protein BCS36_00085 [Desulfovibrio sp. MES5]